MTAPYDVLLRIVTGTWIAAVVLCAVLLYRTTRRPRDEAWAAVRVLLPVLDLFGVWAGTAALVLLFFGRSGYDFAWAASVFLIALMIFFTLYDRAVLVPYMERAIKRLGQGERVESWRADWSFLVRLSAACQLGVLGSGIAVLLLGF